MALDTARDFDSGPAIDRIPFALRSPARIRAASAPGGLARALLYDATVNALKRKAPALSASAPLAVWQRATPFVVLVLIVAAGTLRPEALSHAFAVTLAAPFLMIIALRVAALTSFIRPQTHYGRDAGRNPLERSRRDGPLPDYSILVALYRESGVAAALVRSLTAIDYPRDRLEIIFLLEQEDIATHVALSEAIRLPHMRIVTVPQGQPKTKPRALTYGLQAASGELIAVYDAEDVPERNQLRRAAAAFETGDERLACVQARLGLYNPRETWLTRQFTIEYAALFEAILPLQQRLGFPMPLSGTSNHFRRDALVDAGGWDPYNLTEDADLGLRFARLGYRTQMIDSTTWEEAPSSWKVWLGQRTRWIKGWMQTYLVHMRNPIRLWRDVGGWGFFGIQLTFGALLLSALVHPWCYAAIALAVATGEPPLGGSGVVWMASLAVLFGGYASGIALPAAAILWRRGGRLAFSALWHPVYWLAISIAAYRAVVDLMLRPYYWEKTPHKGTAVTRRRLQP